MGIAYGTTTLHQATKGIVQDGLVFNFDPGVKESYSGSGSSATALTGQSISVNNSPTFTRSNYGGNFVYDGSNDYLSVADSSENFTFANGNFSVGGWIANTVTGDNIIISKTLTSSGGGWVLEAGSTIDLVRYYMDSSAQNQNVTYNPGSRIQDWTYAMATCGTSGAAGDMKIYVNGSLAATNSLAEIKTSVSNTSAVEIGRVNIYNIFQSYGKHDAGLVHIYNKVLNAAEVLQNFNATRHRFGI